MATVLIPMQKGHMARLLLYSGVIERLANQGMQVILLNSKGPDFPLPDDIRKSGHVMVDYLRLPNRRLDSLWQIVYRYLFPTILPTAAAEAREVAMRVKSPAQHATIGMLKRLHLLNFCLHAWIGVRHMAFPGQLFAPIFEKYHPDLVVTGTFAKGLDDYYLLRHARQRGIRTLCTVQSWDGLSGKEYRLETPDRLVVWNDVNQAEAIRLHGYSADHVRVAGVPQFDVYFRPKNQLESRESWLPRLGCDPERKLIFVTPQPGHVRMTVDQTMELFAHALRNHLFVSPSQVLIRPHPAVYSGLVAGQGTESDLRRYEALHPLIKANRPTLTEAGLSADTAQSDHLWLANTLNHSDVVVDWRGTIAIEACAVDTPVIYVDFQDSTGLVSGQPGAPAVNYASFEHLQAVSELNAIPTATTPPDLIGRINRYLIEPSNERAQRQQLTERICFRADGRSADRLAWIIQRFANGLWPTQVEIAAMVGGLLEDPVSSG